MKEKRIIFLSLLILLLGLQACQNLKGQKTRQPAFAFRLVLGEGGGVTGLRSGYTLASDGTVEHWRQNPGADLVIVWSKKVDSSRIAAFRNELVDGGALSLDLRDKGNMTTFVRLEQPDTTYAWSWPAMAKGKAGLSFLQGWYERVVSFCSSQRGAGKK